MADKIKEVAVEEADRIKSLASDAARSGAYLYPIRVSSVDALFLVTRFKCREFLISSAWHSLMSLPTGNGLLHFSPLVMETPHLQTGSDHHFRIGRYNLHVRLYLPAANGSHGIYKRTSCRPHCRGARAQREFYALHHPQQNIPDRRCFGGYL